MFVVCLLLAGPIPAQSLQSGGLHHHCQQLWHSAGFGVQVGN